MTIATQNLYSGTSRAILFCKSTDMYHTYWLPRHIVERGHIIIWVKKRRSHGQWTHPQCVQNNEKYHGIGIGGITWGVIYKCIGRGHRTQYSDRNGAPTTHNKNTNGQHHCQHISNKTLEQKRSKAIDVRFYWIQDRWAQGQVKKIGDQEQPTLVITTPITAPMLANGSYSKNTFT